MVISIDVSLVVVFLVLRGVIWCTDGWLLLGSTMMRIQDEKAFINTCVGLG